MENSDQPVRRKGGLKTMPFVIANEAFEKIASYGLQPNMILYLITVYHFEVASGTSTLFIWGAISNFMPILGAFLSDSYFGRFLVISVATTISLMGLVLLWLTSIIQESRSPSCARHSINCVDPKPSQIALLFTAFALMSIGTGGIRPCSIAFGADQFDNPTNPKNQRILQSFFNWYYASLGISLIIAVTVVVYIQTEYGWIIGFGVPVGLMFVSAIMFFLGTKLYVKVKPNKSLLTGMVQVLVASWKNRHIGVEPDRQRFHYEKGSKLVVPTDELRFLNKACIISNSEKDLNPDGSSSNPWTLCSVLQVEVLKSLIKLIPMWSTGIMIGVTISQHSFPVLQANTLNRGLFSNFKIPPASFGLFGILTLTIWVAVYDRIIVPRLSKHPTKLQGIPVKTRIGIGLFISCLATAAAALVERTRRARALHEGLADTPKAQCLQVGASAIASSTEKQAKAGWQEATKEVLLPLILLGGIFVNMSAMWLIPQHCLAGLAEAFNAIGQIELYYSQLPKSMASIAVALFALGMAIANLCGSLIVNIVDSVSKRGGKESWVSSNLNKGHYDYYYWILTCLSVVNLFYFVLCSRGYKCCEQEKVWDEGIGDEEEKTRGVVSGEAAMVDMTNSKDSSTSMYFSA